MNEDEQDLNVATWIAATVLGFWGFKDAEHIAADIIEALHEEGFV